MLDIKNIETLITNNPKKYKNCKVYKNNNLYCTFTMNKNNNIIKIIDDINKDIAMYTYSKSGIIISENIKYSNENAELSIYKLEENKNIFVEYMFFTVNKSFKKCRSKIKYIFSNNSYNKYLEKYNISNVNKIYYQTDEFEVKSMNNGFEIYFDAVPVYRELYDEKDRLIEIYIIDYDCITNKFIYHDEKIIKQLIFKNKDILTEIDYEYNDNNILKSEIIKKDLNILNKYNYFYDSYGNISQIKSNYFKYDFYYF